MTEKGIGHSEETRKPGAVTSPGLVDVTEQRSHGSQAKSAPSIYL